MKSKLSEFAPHHQAGLLTGYEAGMCFALVTLDPSNVKYVLAMSQDAQYLPRDGTVAGVTLEHIPSIQGIMPDNRVIIRGSMKHRTCYLSSTDKDIFLFSADPSAAVKMSQEVALQKMVQLAARDEISKLEMVSV